VVRVGGQVVAWAFIALCALVLLAAVVVPRIAGATPYTVLTGSMEPHLPPGTLVVDRPASNPNAIPVGTVVTYQLRSGDPTVVTHRIINARTTLDGQVEYLTKGDNNPSPDPEWIKPVQVRGTLWYAAPYLGRLGVLVPSNTHQYGVYVVAGCLSIYAASMLLGGLRDRRRRPARVAGRRARR